MKNRIITGFVFGIACFLISGCFTEVFAEPPGFGKCDDICAAPKNDKPLIKKAPSSPSRKEFIKSPSSAGSDRNFGLNNINSVDVVLPAASDRLVFNCGQNGSSLVGDKKEKDDSDLVKGADVFRKFVEALIWPVVALIIVWKLGPEIKQKLPAMTSFQAGPVKAEFGKQTEEVRKEAEEQFPKPANEPLSPEDEARLLQMAKVSPRAAIIEAWREIETIASKVVDQRTPVSTIDSSYRSRSYKQKSLVTLARELANFDILNAQQLSVFHELRNLRNQAAHADQFEMSFESANNYIQAALSLKNTIQAQFYQAEGQI